MKIFTERGFQEELRRREEAEEKKRYIDERFKWIEDHMYRLDKEIELLKAQLDAVKDRPKMEGDQ